MLVFLKNTNIKSVSSRSRCYFNNEQENFSFQNKVIVWKEHSENRNLKMFPSSCNTVAKRRVEVSPIKTSNICTLVQESTF